VGRRAPTRGPVEVELRSIVEISIVEFAESAVTKKFAIATLAVLVSLAAFFPEEAGAVVCAAGVYRAGCVRPQGAVAVRHPVHRHCAYVRGARVCR